MAFSSSGIASSEYLITKDAPNLPLVGAVVVRSPEDVKHPIIRLMGRDAKATPEEPIIVPIRDERITLEFDSRDVIFCKTWDALNAKLSATASLPSIISTLSGNETHISLNRGKPSDFNAEQYRQLYSEFFLRPHMRGEDLPHSEADLVEYFESRGITACVEPKDSDRWNFCGIRSLYLRQDPSATPHCYLSEDPNTRYFLSVYPEILEALRRFSSIRDSISGICHTDYHAGSVMHEITSDIDLSYDSTTGLVKVETKDGAILRIDRSAARRRLKYRIKHSADFRKEQEEKRKKLFNATAEKTKLIDTCLSSYVTSIDYGARAIGSRLGRIVLGERTHWKRDRDYAVMNNLESYLAVLRKVNYSRDLIIISKIFHGRRSCLSSEEFSGLAYIETAKANGTERLYLSNKILRALLLKTGKKLKAISMGDIFIQSMLKKYIAHNDLENMFLLYWAKECHRLNKVFRPSIKKFMKDLTASALEAIGANKKLSSKKKEEDILHEHEERLALAANKEASATNSKVVNH